MRLEFSYRIEDVREAVQTALVPGSRKASKSRHLLGWFTFVLPAALWFVAVNLPRGAPEPQEGPELDLLLVLMPAALPGVVLLVFLGWSFFKQIRLRPVASREPGARAVLPSPTRGAAVIGMIIGGLFITAALWLTTPGPSILVHPSRPLMVRVAMYVSIAEMFILFAYAKLTARLAVRTQWNAKPTWRRAKVMTLDDAGFSISDALSRTDYRWEYFSKARETENLLVLHAEDGLMHLIPKRAIREGELDAARALIQNGIPDSKFLVVPGGFAVLPVLPTG